MSGRWRCLFVMEDSPISPVAGGPAIYYTHLELLAHAGFEITLLILADERARHSFQRYVSEDPETWSRVRSWCAAYRVIPFRRPPKASAPVRHALLALWDPVSYAYPPECAETREAFKQVLDEVQPDVIWGEHRDPVLLALRATTNTPIIFCHHDWQWRLGPLRPGTASGLRASLKWWAVERAEKSLARHVAGCISGSSTEAAELRALGQQHIAYLPPTYVPVPAPVTEPPRSARIVHLGGMRTTATRVGLQRFLEVAWPLLVDLLTDRPELWVVGDLDGASPELLAELGQVGAVCLGFVRDLHSVLRPYDLHIVPWEHNTGTRTRIPLILNHAQVLVSTRAAAKCLPELQSDVNCMLVDDLPSMSYAVAQLLGNKLRRVELAHAGRATFLEHFTREALQPRFDEFMKGFMEAVQRDRRRLHARD
jgi:glycosyl transferase family 1